MTQYHIPTDWPTAPQVSTGQSARGEHTGPLVAQYYWLLTRGSGYMHPPAACRRMVGPAGGGSPAIVLEMGLVRPPYATSLRLGVWYVTAQADDLVSVELETTTEADSGTGAAGGTDGYTAQPGLIEVAAAVGDGTSGTWDASSLELCTITIDHIDASASTGRVYIVGIQPRWVTTGRTGAIVTL